jgi:hypothetical protein
MKRNLIGTLSLVVLTVLLNATGAYAQAVAKGDVPFAFMLANKQLPSGHYGISTNGMGTILIRNEDTGAAFLSQARDDEPSKTSPKLVFHYLVNQYFLAEVWGADGRAGMILPSSPLEKELRIANGTKHTAREVVVALK